MQKPITAHESAAQELAAADDDLIDDHEYQYAGFWIRVLANIIDSLIVALVTVPLIFILGTIGMINLDHPTIGLSDILLNLAQVVFVVWCWIKFAGTPGKRLLKLKVLDADTGRKLSVKQAVIRYIGYFPAVFFLFLGLIWVAFDKRKQGWHDKMAGSVVVKEIR